MRTDDSAPFEWGTDSMPPFHRALPTHLSERSRGRFGDTLARMADERFARAQVTAICIGPFFVLFLAKGVPKFMGYRQIQKTIHREVGHAQQVQASHRR